MNDFYVLYNKKTGFIHSMNIVGSVVLAGETGLDFTLVRINNVDFPNYFERAKVINGIIYFEGKENAPERVDIKGTLKQLENRIKILEAK